MPKYNQYKVLWAIIHEKGGVQRTQLSGIILARNLAECLKKSELKKNSYILNCYLKPWYQIKPVTVYEMGWQEAFCYTDGFWRRFWTPCIYPNTFD